jgi:hypothetical protein
VRREDKNRVTISDTGVVHLVSTLGSISARAELSSIITSALPVATVLTRQRVCVRAGACVCVWVQQREETHLHAVRVSEYLHGGHPVRVVVARALLDDALLGLVDEQAHALHEVAHHDEVAAHHHVQRKDVAVEGALRAQLQPAVARCVRPPPRRLVRYGDEKVANRDILGFGTARQEMALE